MRPKLNSNGSALVMTMVACAAIGVVLFVLMDSWKVGFHQIALANTRISALNLKANLSMYFKNDASWAKIRDNAANASLSCLRPAAAPCSSLEARSITVLMDGSGATVYDSSANQGFGHNGERCQPTSSADPNCPFRVDVQWEPQCSGAPCTPALIKITGTVTVVGGRGVPLNASNYQFQVVRAP